jgi:glycosyltransferase involved in cell wall biosynthesis
MKEMSATIVIATKDRKNDLAVALASCFAQTVPVEVIVIDDGSIDETSEMVKKDFPKAILFTFEDSKGYIARRNYGASKASNEVIISIDDDAVFSTPAVIEGVLREFSDPRIAAIAIPFININQSDCIHQLAPDSECMWITNDYIGTSHAIRRNVFLENGGYCEYFVHQGEEGDLCIRLLDRGYCVKLGSADPIHHFESPNRSGFRMNYYGQRNLILFAWRNVPLPFFLIHLSMTIFNGLVWGIRNKVLIPRAKGTIAGLASVVFKSRLRNPVKERTYRLYRNMKKNGPLPIKRVFESQ